MIFTGAAIHLPHDATPAERLAAEELGAHLRQITGLDRPVCALSADVTVPAFLIGRKAATPWLPDFDWDVLRDDGCLVKRVGPVLLLAGATPRGTLYAVYEFLDRVLGCRWYAPDCSVIPTRTELDLEEIDLVHVPPFRYREPYFSCVWKDADWEVRNRVNGHLTPLGARQGGKWRYAGDGFAHTFFPLVPPEQYFASHPEYYSEIDGQRTYLAGQLCLTNEELPAVMCDAIREWLRRDPEARIVSVTQNDWNGWCRCDRCRAIDEAEGSPSGTMIAFVNRIAELLEPEFPHVFFDTFAYTYTVQPPKTMRPRHNVIVRLCNITPCCDAHPLEHCTQNRWFSDVLRGWCAIAPEVFVWDYFNNFSHCFQPFPNLDALAADIALYARSGVTGLFCQGDSHPPKGSGDMAELRAWLFARLLWDPGRDAWALVDEFLGAYYGPAAGMLREYLDLLHARAREEDAHFNLFSPLETPAVAGEIIPCSHMIFDRAEAEVAADAVLLERVRAARLPVEYMTWKRELRFCVRGDRYEPVSAELAGRLQRFFTLAEARGAGALRERGTPLAQMKTMAAGFQIVRLKNDRLEISVIPGLGGRLTSLLDLSNGLEWMHAGETEQIDYPCAGGYEEYSEHRWRTPGWNEEYRIEERRPDMLAITAQLVNDFVLSRSYRLEGDAVRITSTLTNPAGIPHVACFRSMPEFAAGDLAAAMVSCRLADGAWRELAPWRQSDALAGSGWLEGDARPHGLCRLTRDGHALILQYDESQIMRVLFDWDRALGYVRLGLSGDGVVLQPGESIVIAQRWSVG